MCSVFIILLALLLVGDLFRGSWEAIQHFGLRFLIGTTWDPVAHEFGSLPPAVGTLIKSLIALIIAVAVSIGSAVFIAFYIQYSLRDRKSTRLNSSHLGISYAVFCLKKKKK